MLTLLVVTSACSSGGSAADNDHAVASRAPRVQVVNQNLLHGDACPPSTDHCRRPDRVRLFASQIARTCPDLVAIEEGSEAMVAQLRPAVRHICGGRYRIVWDGDPGLDREIVLTTAHLLGSRRFRLAGPLRSAYWVRVAAPVGVVDLWATHLASGSDDGPCGRATCPPPCRSTDTLRTCQARQVVGLARRHRYADGVTVLAGDLNARPGDPAIEAIRAAGFVDTHLAVGNRECDRRTGGGCTSGRDDTSVTGLSDASAHESARLDYAFLGPGRTCTTARPTGVFAAAPEPHGPKGLVHPSDHAAVVATIACPTTRGQRAEATGATLATKTTADPQTGVPDGPTSAIAKAFATVFGGGATIPERVAGIDGGEAVATVVADGYARNRAVADRITVRIDRAELVHPDEADVTFTLLLDGSAVLDNLPGRAVRVDGSWLVTKATFCSVGTLGSTAVPAACR
ncbi:MAG: hypothetical protein ACR2MB_04560 [Acidimicrobiales bacterium]